MVLQIVKFADDDLPSIVELLNEEYRNSNEFIPFDKERVLSQTRRRHLTILVAKEKSKILGIIGTHLHENSEKDVSWLAAAKGPNQEAIENTLITEVEKDPAVNTIVTSIDEENPKISNWIKRGYELQPGFERMSTRLNGLIPIPKIGSDVILRSLRNNEEKEFVEAVNTGFGWQRLELGDMEIWKSEDPPFNEEWVQVAEIKGKIVSVVVAKPDSDAIKYIHLNRGYLGPAATLPEFRNRHLASALTARSMNFLFEKGMDSVRLGTSEQNVSSNALLGSLGFRVESVRKTMRKKLRNTQRQRNDHFGSLEETKK
jgi:ribosomal protein S18 acetylase RimI-like enzyme